MDIRSKLTDEMSRFFDHTHFIWHKGTCSSVVHMCQNVCIICIIYFPGEAVILEGMVGLAENNAILQTLQTKWKNISVDWDGGIKPSIN